MPSFRTLGNKFFGNTIGTAAGVAAGTSTSRALDPILQQLANDTWELHSVVPVDAYVMAEGLAQGQVDKATAYKYAAQQGIGSDQMDAIVDVANVGPAIGYAYEAWRRGFLTDTEFATALQRTGLEDQWFDAMRQLKTRLLDPADLARGIHKGLIPDPGLLAVPAPTGVGKVPAYPVYDIDALQAAAGFGYTRDDLGVLVGLQGNPMGAHEAAQAQFRGVIEPVDYDRAIAQGNTRNEWGAPIREQSRQIPTAHEFIENALRGYTTLADALAGAAKHGMTEEDATLIYQNAGRPMAVRQITTGLARGGKFEPEAGEIKDPYMASIVEGSLKPAYYDLAMANRYTLPGYFVVKAMLTSGALTVEQAATIFKQEGWPPDLAEQAATALGGAGTTKTDPWLAKANGYLFTALHKGYNTTPEYETWARGGMDKIGIKAATQDAILGLFAYEKDTPAGASVKTLTPPTGGVGTSVQTPARGFAANATLTVTVGGVAANVTGGGQTDGAGNSELTFTIPQVSAGSQFVSVTDGKNAAAPPTAFVVT